MCTPLLKAITQNSGFDATYWRIDQVRVDWRRGQARFRLSGYKDEQARHDNPNRAVMEERSYSIVGDEFDLVDSRRGVGAIPGQQRQPCRASRAVKHNEDAGNILEARINLNSNK
jgi:hypothetical protein